MTDQPLSIILLATSVIAFVAPPNGKADPPVEAIPFCTVLENAAAYDGKEITVRGIYYRVIHGSILTGQTCHEKANMMLSRDWKADKQALKLVNSRARDNQATAIALRGTFRVAKQGECFGQTCSPYEIEEHELLSAAIPSK
jgi:hypothetical protein